MLIAPGGIVVHYHEPEKKNSVHEDCFSNSMTNLAESLIGGTSSFRLFSNLLFCVSEDLQMQSRHLQSNLFKELILFAV